MNKWQKKGFDYLKNNSSKLGKLKDLIYKIEDMAGDLAAGYGKSSTGREAEDIADGMSQFLKSKGIHEKSTSQSQQQAAGIALAAKRGDIPKSKLKGASKQMAKMPEKELRKFAKTKHKGLPKKVGEDRLREAIRGILDELFSDPKFAFLTFDPMRIKKLGGKKLKNIKKLTPGAKSHLKEMQVKFQDMPKNAPPEIIDFLTRFAETAERVLRGVDMFSGIHEWKGKSWSIGIRSYDLFTSRPGVEDDDLPVYTGKGKLENLGKKLWSSFPLKTKYKLEIFPSEKYWVEISIVKK